MGTPSITEPEGLLMSCLNELSWFGDEKRQTLALRLEVGGVDAGLRYLHDTALAIGRTAYIELESILQEYGF